MFLRLLMILTLVPLVEIYVLLRISDRLGWQGTFLLVILTGFLGASLMRRQGLRLFIDIQKSLAQGQMPSEALTRGFFVFVGGLVLLTPGVLTDIIGLSFLFPPTQKLWKQSFQKKWHRAVDQGHVHVYSSTHFRGFPGTGHQGYQDHTSRPSQMTDVIDVEVKSRGSKDSED